MKLIFTFLFIGFTFLSFGQQKLLSDVLSREQKIIKDSLQLMEQEFNFGKIPQGKAVMHTFTLKNAGKTPFGLENVQASCGCTTPQWSKDIIEPGQTSSIVVGYNAASEGAFNKTITINYNKNETKILTIKGEVWKTPLTSAPLNEAIENLKSQL